jgi:AAA domain
MSAYEIVPPPRRFLISAADLQTKPPSKPAWLVDQLILEASNGWIGAGAKIGKSYVALDLLLTCALGQPWLGKFAIPRPLTVVLIEEEDSAWRVYERLLRLCNGRNVDMPSNFHLAIRQGIQLDDSETFEPLLLELGEIGPDLIVWDVFNRLHTADEGRRDQMMPILKRIDRVRDRLRCSNLIAHHSRKPGVSGPDLASGGQRLRGLSEFWAWAENSLYLSRHKQAVTIEPESKDAIVEPFTVHLDDMEGEPESRRWVYDGSAAAKLTAGEKHRAAIVKALEGGARLDAEAIATATRVTSDTIRRYLTSLVKDDVLDYAEVPNGKGRRRLYFLQAESAPQLEGTP